MPKKGGLPFVKEDSALEIKFNLSLVDGLLVEETDEDETFEFTMGDGTFVSGLEMMLVGLEQGTTAKLTLAPESAFGQPDSTNFQTMSLADFPKEMPLNVGHVIGFNTPTGLEIPGSIYEVNGNKVVVDFNHPLAGATVVFTATIINIFS